LPPWMHVVLDLDLAGHQPCTWPRCGTSALVWRSCACGSSLRPPSVAPLAARWPSMSPWVRPCVGPACHHCSPVRHPSNVAVSRTRRRRHLEWPELCLRLSAGHLVAATPWRTQDRACKRLKQVRTRCLR
jgi:hypothetical protein